MFLKSLGRACANEVETLASPAHLPLTHTRSGGSRHWACHRGRPRAAGMQSMPTAYADLGMKQLARVASCSGEL